LEEKGFKRKLIAILSADAVGYSRLMNDDEEAIVTKLVWNDDGSHTSISGWWSSWRKSTVIQQVED